MTVTKTALVNVWIINHHHTHTWYIIHTCVNQLELPHHIQIGTSLCTCAAAQTCMTNKLSTVITKLFGEHSVLMQWKPVMSKYLPQPLSFSTANREPVCSANFMIFNMTGCCWYLFPASYCIFSVSSTKRALNGYWQESLGTKQVNKA